MHDRGAGPRRVRRLPARLLKDVRRRAAEFQRGLGRDRLDVGDAADAVGAEEPSLGTHVLGLESFEGGAPCSNRGGFFSTFLLMRYHRAHARIRQVIFGLQSLVSISLMMLMVKQKLAQPAAEIVDAQIAFQDAIVANGNLACFLGNDDGNGVGFFRQSKGGPVSQPEVAIKILALSQWKNAGRRNHAVVVNDEPAVVQNGFRMEDGQREFLRINRIEHDTGLDEMA